MVRKIIANSCTRARDSKWDHFSRFSWQVRPKFRLKCLYWHFKTHWFPYSGRVETKFHKFSKVALRCVTSYIIVEVYWPLENYTAAPNFKIDVAKYKHASLLVRFYCVWVGSQICLIQTACSRLFLLGSYERLSSRTQKRQYEWEGAGARRGFPWFFFLCAVCAPPLSRLNPSPS